MTGVAAGSVPDKPDLLWSFKTGGPVRSSAVIGGGRVFIGSDDSQVYAIDFASGQEVWRFKADAAMQAPPLLSGATVFAGSTEGVFYALDAATGKLQWKFQTDGKIAGSANIVVDDGQAGACSSAATISSSIASTPPPASPPGPFKPPITSMAPAPSKRAGPFLAVAMLCCTLSPCTTAASSRRLKPAAYIAASVVLAGDRAYFGHYENEFLCVNLADGKTLWHFKDLEFPYMSAAAVTADRVIFGGFDKALHCLNRADGCERLEIRHPGQN